MSEHKGFIRVFDMNVKVHIVIPIHFIKAVAPLFEISDVIQSAEPVLGHTVITMMDTKGIIVADSFDDIMKAIGAIEVTPGPTISVPERTAIVVPESNVIDIKKPH